MKKIFITGVNGQAGFYLSKYFSGKYDIFGCSKDDFSYNKNIKYFQCDISDVKKISKLINGIKPDIIINTAALSNVDECERNKSLAYNVNYLGIQNIVNSIEHDEVLLIQLSTDYIFDGRKGEYSEEDIPNPVNYYGETKLMAEEYIHSQMDSFLIVRLSVLYSHFIYKENFFDWVYSQLNNEKAIKVVIDLINTPTYVYNLFKGLEFLIEKKVNGVYHISNQEKVSRYDFAIKIANFFGFNADLIKKVLSSEINFTAKRPLNTTLSIEKIKKLGYVPLNLEETFNDIKKYLE